MKKFLPIRTIHIRKQWVNSIVASVLLCAGGLAHGADYNITDLGADFRPTSISDYGLISGTILNSAAFHDGTTLTVLESSAQSNSINSWGLSAGHTLGGSPNAPRLWQGNTSLSDLNQYSGLQEARGVNEFDETVGLRLVDNLFFRPFVHDLTTGDLLTLTTLGGGNAWANDINALGQVTGASEDGKGSTLAFRYDRHEGLVSLGTMIGYEHSEGLSINDKWTVAGTSFKTKQEYNRRAIVAPLSRGIIRLGTLNHDPVSIANDISNQGHVVGQSIRADGKGRAFIYDTSNIDLLFISSDPQIPTRIYGASNTGAGVRRSNNRGDSWTTINNGLIIKEVNVVVVHPQDSNVLYAATKHGIYKSTTGGDSWFVASPPPAEGSSSIPHIDDLEVFSIHFRLNDPTTILAGTIAGVYISNDEGASWQPASTNISRVAVLDFAEHPTTGYLFIGTNRGVYRSFDGGNNWSIQNGAQEGTIDKRLRSTIVPTVLIDKNDPHVLYAGTNGGGVYKATTSSANLEGSLEWSPQSDGLVDRTVYYMVADTSSKPSTIYAGTASLLSATNNGGDQWLQNTAFGSRGVYSLHLTQDGISTTLYAASFDGGVFRSDNSGGHKVGEIWTAITEGTSKSDIYSLDFPSPADSTLYAGTSAGIFKSVAGSDWIATNRGIVHLKTTAFVADTTKTPSPMWAGTLDDGVFSSSDEGQTWIAANTELDYRTVNALALDTNVTPSVLYAGTTGGAYRSNDGGNHWIAVNNGITDRPVFSLLLDSSTIPNTLYAGTNNGVYRSTDMGDHWQPINNTLTGVHITGLLKEGSNLYATTTEGGIFRSTNGGVNWVNGYGDLPIGTEIHNLIVDRTVPSKLYVGTNTGIYSATSGIWAWTTLGATDISTFKILSIAQDPNDTTIMYAGTAANGVYQSTDSGATWLPFNTGMANVVSRMRNLFQDVDDPGGTWTELNNATSVNNNGKIVGWGIKDGVEHGFLLTPLVEPEHADLVISQTISPETIKKNVPMNFNISVKNLGPAVATNAYLVSWLPPNTVFRHAATSHGACAKDPTGLARCRLETINPGDTAHVEISIEPIEGSQRLLNIARVRANEYDPDMSNNVTSLGQVITVDKCFIATAAYGSLLDPHVTLLRNFRDRYLMPYEWGRGLVNLYYHYSPPLAAQIEQHEGLKLATRVVLTPIVYSIKYPPLFWGTCLLAGLGYTRRRYRKSINRT